MTLLTSILTAVSLCADCFAVTLCSSVTIRKISWHGIARIAAAFAIIQTALLGVGWVFGYLLVGLVEKISHIIGFLMLLYVGGSMLLEGIRGKCEERDLNGLRNVVLGGIATSIDALAVGISASMDGMDFAAVLPLLISVFVVTALSVVCGIAGGKVLGQHYGRVAEIAGGCILICIGIAVLI